MTLESSKISVLLGALDFNPSVGQKTVIVANAVQEVEEVFKVNASVRQCQRARVGPCDLQLAAQGREEKPFVWFSVSSSRLSDQGLSSRSAFCLMTHEGLSHQFDLVTQQWRRDIGRGTHVFLGKLQTCCSQPLAEHLSRLYLCCF